MSEFSINVGVNRQIAVCMHSDGSGILASYLIPAEADPQAALATLKSGTGFDGAWSIEQMNGELRHARGGRKG